MQIPPADTLIPILIVIFFAIGIHEYAHCALADAAGDPTPRYYGRVTLNLFKHFEPLGTIMIILSTISGYGLGWGKPAPMDARKMRNPRWDLFAAVAAGPISNLLQAVVYATILRLMIRAESPALGIHFVQMLLLYGILVNISLMFFNLIPFGPLDGHWLVGQLLPEKQRVGWYRFNRSIGMVGLFVLIMVSDILRRNGGPDPIYMLIGRPTEATFRFLVGIPRVNLSGS